MAISSAQRERRRAHLGSSDIAAILGRNPYSSERTVYYSKVMPLPEDDTASTANGNFLEPAIVSWAADRLRVEVERDVEVIVDGQLEAANLDARIVGRREAIEAKHCADPRLLSAFGDEYTDAVPEHYMLQCQHQIAAADLDVVWVAVLLAVRGLEWRLYRVERHDALIDDMRKLGRDWWERYVTTQTPPDGIECPPLPALKALGREPNKVIQLDAEALELWAKYDLLGKAEKEAGEWRAVVQAAILATLGDAECGVLPDGRTLTYLTQNSARRVDADLLRCLSSEIYDQVVTQKSHRVLRIKAQSARRKSAA